MRMSSAPGHLRRRWRRWRGLSGRQRRLTLQAWLLLPLAAAALRLVPLRRLLALLALRVAAEPGSHPGHPGGGDAFSLDLAGAIVRAAAWTPWGGTCLAQALVGTVLLRRQGRPAELTLAVATADARLTAHAWLESGGAPISGFPVRPEWRPLVRFQG